jgi:hypothetical protein
VVIKVWFYKSYRWDIYMTTQKYNAKICYDGLLRVLANIEYIFFLPTLSSMKIKGARVASRKSALLLVTY